MNVTPKTYDEKIARLYNKVKRAIERKNVDEYFWFLVEWAFVRVSEKDSRDNLSFLKEVSNILHQRNNTTKDIDLSGLEALIKAKLEKQSAVQSSIAVVKENIEGM